MVNISVPSNATAIDMLEWTNTITGNNWSIAIFTFFFTFVLPFIYLTSIGHNKSEVVMICSALSAISMVFLSLTGIIPEILVIAMIMLSGIAAIVHYFEAK